MKTSLLLFLFSFGLLIGCQSGVDETLIYGKWKAADFIDNGTPKEVDLENVYFSFNTDGTYEYHGTVQQEEAGRFHITGKLLYTTDTTVTQSIEKSVKIEQLTSDSLYFKMNAAGNTQVFKLYK